MKQICDRRAELIGLMGRPLVCHLRIWQGEVPTVSVHPPFYVVVITEVVDNPGASVTNAAELIASQVCSLYRIEPETVLWFEHYGTRAGGYTREEETFDSVMFTALPEPRWCGMAYGDVYLWVDDPCWTASSRRVVETLIGEEFTAIEGTY